MALLATRPGRFRIARLLGMLAGGAGGQGAEKESMSYGQNSHRARCPTHDPHFKHRFMINQAR